MAKPSGPFRINQDCANLAVMNKPFSKEEISRYARHFALPGFTVETQEKLRSARVAVVGAGGLGLPVIQYLAAAGCGYIRIIDPDKVERMNLQRQVLYTEADLGQPKAVCAAEWVQRFNSRCQAEPVAALLDPGNARDLLKDTDLVVDATDNFPARYLVCDAAWFLEKPVIYGSVFQYAGQVSVFNLPVDNGRRGPNYRDLFPTPPGPGEAPDCTIGGVLGALTGVIGTLMAVETLKVLTGLGEPLSGKLLVYDALRATTRTFRFAARDDNPLSGKEPAIKDLIDYEAFCGTALSAPSVPSIEAEELRKLLHSENAPILLDVREAFEREIMCLESIHIPERLIDRHLEKIPPTGPLVVYCKEGIRSARVVKKLLARFPGRDIRNLSGGIMAWKRKFEPGWAEY